MREIKFELVAKNMSGEILREVYTLEQLMDSSWGESFSVDIIAKRQYTGLKDKNGVEIYEGDVIKATDGNNNHFFQIKWIGHNARFSFIDNNNVFPFWKIWQFKPEVIGNIYENPELIK